MGTTPAVAGTSKRHQHEPVSSRKSRQETLHRATKATCVHNPYMTLPLYCRQHKPEPRVQNSTPGKEASGSCEGGGGRAAASAVSTLELAVSWAASSEVAWAAARAAPAAAAFSSPSTATACNGRHCEWAAHVGTQFMRAVGGHLATARGRTRSSVHSVVMGLGHDTHQTAYTSNALTYVLKRLSMVSPMSQQQCMPPLQPAFGMRTPGLSTETRRSPLALA